MSRHPVFFQTYSWNEKSSFDRCINKGLPDSEDIVLTLPIAWAKWKYICAKHLYELIKIIYNSEYYLRLQLC